MLYRLPAFASAAVLALSLSAPAFAQNSSWGNASNGYGLYHESNGAAQAGQDTNENGYGYYHESNGAATGWGSADNGYGLYHQSNSSATGWGSAETGNGLYHQSNSSATKKPIQSKQ